MRLLVASDGEKVRIEVEGAIATNAARLSPTDARRIGRALQRMADKVSPAAVESTT